jgi:hypothetical protein
MHHTDEFMRPFLTPPPLSRRRFGVITLLAAVLLAPLRPCSAEPGATTDAGSAQPPSAAAPATPPVDIALVLAVDVSESVDAGEYQLQHEGIARAFEDERLIDAISAGARGGIAVTVIEWSDRDKQVVTVDWTRVTDRASAAAFAAAVRKTQRSSNGLTALGDALLAARAAFERLPCTAERRVIDVSGDGMANIGPSPRDIRDALVAEGITINGLAIHGEESAIEFYYNDYVVGGAGAFLMQAENFQSFAGAMLNKLLSEVSGVEPPPALAGKRKLAAEPVPQRAS